MNSSASQTLTVSSGVPQGSAMGPVLFLFLLHVNDIPKQVECDISMLVDDTKIYTSVKTLQILKGYKLTWTSHHMKLYKYHTRLNVRSNFFTQRIINS